MRVKEGRGFHGVSQEEREREIRLEEGEEQKRRRQHAGVKSGWGGHFSSYFSRCENWGGGKIDGGSPRSVAKREFTGERQEERVDPRSRLE